MSIDIGNMQWPKPPDERQAERDAEYAELSARLRVLEPTLETTEVVQDNNDDWVDELLTTWPEHLPRLVNPGDWRASVGEEEYDKIMYDHSLDTLFQLDTIEYMYWLRKHMIIDDKAASMVRDVLMDYERGGDRNLRYIAFADQNYYNTARKFEQDYLGLPPLEVEEDDEFGPIDKSEYDGLRICEDGLYGPYDFRFGGVRNGGFLPTAAIANALKTTPEELIRRLSNPAIFEEDEHGDLIAPWNMIRMDNYLLLARPHDEDPSQVIVGPVLELTDFGSYLLENLLRAYEAGTQQ